ncbi:ribose-5-phosphate isomerase [Devosia yakushimensis]|uniref:Ribose-5-phosphate isomerase n=1 Tax=Devosia yakushimensis TaxID=470028 RepID=A0ABQ5U8X9_9HYPH|nr:RpiB/LacA/LacB family sugar-phosphate isomerase [Devosia yakushimensis]GLQ08180.1 ribose-5-phosphate isomerase [Devosia yakushimensis]
MRVVIGNDHAGFSAKAAVTAALRNLGIEPIDRGTDSDAPVDFPVISRNVCSAIQEGLADRAILVCGTGVGASMAANRIPGIRAFVGHDTYSARQAVEHDDANVMCLGAWIIGPELMRLSIEAFLSAEFSTSEEFRRRVGMLAEMEKR